MYDVEELKKRVNLKDVVQQAGIALKNNRACCPFHREKTASFFVHPSGAYYKCFGCGAGGDVINFIMRYYNLNFKSALDFLADRYGATEISKAKQLEVSIQREKERRFAEYINTTYIDLCTAFRLQSMIIHSEDKKALTERSAVCEMAYSDIDFTDYLLDLLIFNPTEFYTYRKEAEKIVRRYT